VQEASFREQIRATKEIADLQEKQLAVVEQQMRLGGTANIRKAGVYSPAFLFL